MRTIYLDCSMGAAGDMLTASLLGLLPRPEDFAARMNSLGIPSVSVSVEKTARCGISGLHYSVRINGEEEEVCGEHHAHEHEQHHHTGFSEITRLVGHLDLPQQVREDVLAVYRSIAETESEVHGIPVSEIHFHEVGSLDAVADVVGFSLLLHELAPERMIASPVCVGSGQIRCAHGILPVPAPATALLLCGIPSYAGQVSGELCTPTGAALLKHFVTEFIPMPALTAEKIGYGMGSRDNGTANCVRAFLGESAGGSERAAELCCNLDDMTPEEIAFAEEKLFAGGALDVWTTAAQMKKNRPGTVLSCLCREERREELIRLMFRHTSTIGIRWQIWNRAELSRTEYMAEALGKPVRVKKVSGEGISREKPEFEDLAAIAREQGISIREVRKML